MLQDVREALEKLPPSSSSLEAQVWSLCAVARMRPDEFEARERICRYLEDTFAREVTNGPGGKCKVVPFGSTVNGLGFRGCDLDLYAEMGAEGRRRRSWRRTAMCYAPFNGGFILRFRSTSRDP